MQEFEQTETVKVASEQVFAFVSEIKNLPQYLPTVRQAELKGGNRIHMQGQAPGASYNDSGFFKADPQQQRMEWGADDGHGYQGWLQVQSRGEQACEVTIHLSIDPQSEAIQKMDQAPGGYEQAMNEGLKKALQSIKRLCEGSGGKAEVAGQKK